MKIKRKTIERLSLISLNIVMLVTVAILFKKAIAELNDTELFITFICYMLGIQVTGFIWYKAVE